MYIICIKDLISNKWRQVIIPLSRKFYVQMLLNNKIKVILIIILLNPNMYIICIKDLISISGAKFHPIILIIKFHMQFEKKTIAPDPSTYIYRFIEKYRTPLISSVRMNFGENVQ